MVLACVVDETEHGRRRKPTESGFSVEALVHDGEPWKPVPYQLHHLAAARALWAGTATAEQQQMFMNYMIGDVCRTGDMSYRADSDRDTVFAEGRRFVGNTLIKLIEVPYPRNHENAT